MRLLRVLLLLLLSLAIPLHGVAAAIAVEPPCAMDKPAPEQRVHSQGYAAPCCNEADAAARTGKVCKSGQDCQSVTFALALPAPFLPLALRHDPAMVLRPIPRREAARAPIWRPPLIS